MASLIDASPEAQTWLAREIDAQGKRGVHTELCSAVIWSDARDANGQVIAPFDPVKIAEAINAASLPLQHDHDPGRPIGKVLSAAHFQAEDGTWFVAAVLGYFGQETLVSFETLGIDLTEAEASPTTLPSLPDDFRIVVEADLKEVDAASLTELVAGLEAPVELKRRSHNSADIAQQLVAISVVFSLLVWNPFVKTFAQEAGKDAYKLAREALKNLIERAGHLEKPLVEIQSHQSGCTVSFLIRGKGIGLHSKANAALPGAALQASRLIENVLGSGAQPIRLVYEFVRESEIWAPSFVELADGRLVSDTLNLMAIENLPKGLSLGVTVRDVAET